MSDSEAEEETLKEEGKVLNTDRQIRVNVKVNGEEATTQFVVKLTTPFSKIFNTFCDRRKVERRFYTYIYDGETLHEESSGKMMEWKVGRTYNVDAHMHQEGGWNASGQG